MADSLSRLWLRVLLVASCTAAACQAADVAITPDDIAISRRIPSVGNEVTFTVTIRAPAQAPLAGDCRLTASANGEALFDGIVVGPGAASHPGYQPPAEISAGETQEVPLTWVPAGDGWYDVSFRIALAGDENPDNNEAVPRIPVTVRDLYFVWFGAPKEFEWCNVPTTVKPDDAEWWLRHGAIPCAWKGGVCYKDWPVERFTESYNASPWIAIDEVGALDEAGQKIMAAVRAHKQAHPDGFRAIWFMGAHEYWAEVKDFVDLFVPEIYLNYRGDHLGQFDAYIRRTREAGVIDQMVPGLGINIRRDEDKNPIVTPTTEDVLRQIRYLKTIAPEIPGIGFFNSGAAAPGVAEYADQLCRDYYIQPVVSLVPGSLAASLRGGQVELSAQIDNRGGMTARGVTVAFGKGYGDDFESREVREAAAVAVGDQQKLEALLPPPQGLAIYAARVRPHPGYTVLNDSAWTVLADTQAAARGPLACRPPADAAAASLPLFCRVSADSDSNRVHLLDSRGNSQYAVDAEVLAGFPGEQEATLTWVPRDLPAGRPAVFQLATGEREPDRAYSWWDRQDDAVTVTTRDYSATLDLAQDQIISLKPAGVDSEILGSPWTFTCTGREGFGAPELRPGPVGLSVRVPFRSEAAEGFSRYLFYVEAPVIRIERYFRPLEELTVKTSVEGCRLEQQGGCYALQPGVGGPVRRGKLQDGKDYRDLLFGYLGDHPSPHTADKCGWLDFSFREDVKAGMGVAIERRWQAARSKVYDVTRLYDGSDYIQVLNLWSAEITIGDPQTQIVYLLPHRYINMEAPEVIPPAKALWEALHSPARLVTQ